jgi:hypothetical protein
MPVTVALGAIPWKVILATTPPIVSEARKLQEAIRSYKQGQEYQNFFAHGWRH